jgi:hypothetical protein
MSGELAGIRVGEVSRRGCHDLSKAWEVEGAGLGQQREVTRIGWGGGRLGKSERVDSRRAGSSVGPERAVMTCHGGRRDSSRHGAVEGGVMIRAAKSLGSARLTTRLGKSGELAGREVDCRAARMGQVRSDLVCHKGGYGMGRVVRWEDRRGVGVGSRMGGDREGTGCRQGRSELTRCGKSEGKARHGRGSTRVDTVGWAGPARSGMTCRQG